MEKIANAIHALDNLIVAMKLPVEDEVYMKDLRESLPAVREELHQGYIDALGVGDDQAAGG